MLKNGINYTCFWLKLGEGGGTVGHHAPLLSFLTAPLKQLLVLSALYGKLPAMFGDHFPMLILIQGSLV